MGFFGQSAVSTCRSQPSLQLQLPCVHTAGFECGIKDIIRLQIGEPALISYKFDESQLSRVASADRS